MIKDRHNRGDEVFYTCSTEKSLNSLKQSTLHGTGIIFNFSEYESGIKTILSTLNNDLDCIVLNAATRNKRLLPFHEKSEKSILEDLQDNILANTFLLKEILPIFMNKKFGRIVMVSSISVDNGTSCYSTYCMYKGALEQLILNISVDYAEFNILSNILRLGLFKTSRTRMFWKRQEYIDEMSKIIPTGKLGEPSQINEILNSLLQKDQYINGSKIDVSGGMPKRKGVSLLNREK